MFENLKLPLCPKCVDTRNVIVMDVLVRLHVHERHPWYECRSCGIRWHALEGIREAGDNTPCFG